MNSHDHSTNYRPATPLRAARLRRMGAAIVRRQEFHLVFGFNLDEAIKEVTMQRVHHLPVKNLISIHMMKMARDWLSAMIESAEQLPDMDIVDLLKQVEKGGA